MYVSLLYSTANGGGAYNPLNNSNIYNYVTEALFDNANASWFEAGYYNEIKLYIENELFDDI
jgi:hypothetical protein